MKKTIRYMMLGAVGLGLAACSDDGPVTVGGGESVAAVVTADIAGTSQSRAVGTQWDSRDQIGISGTVSGKYCFNQGYSTWSGDGAFTLSWGDGIYFEDTNTATFSAYYPFKSDLNVDNPVISFNTANQSNSKSFDFLYATGAKGSAINPAISFTGNAAFNHRMAQLALRITAEPSNGFDATDILQNGVVKLSDVENNGEFNALTGEVSMLPAADADSRGIELAAGSMTVDGTTATANLILAPQTLSDATLTVDYNGKTFSTKISPVLESGKSYSCTVRLTKTGLKVVSAEIVDWGWTNYPSIDVTVPNPHKPNKVLMRSEPALYFADRNIGATSPQDAGRYFWWGDIKGHYLDEGYDFSFNNPEIQNSKAATTSLIVMLAPEYDAATVLLGGDWHVPAQEDLQWLKNNCTWEWQEADEATGKVAGYNVRNENLEGAEIFLPAAGMTGDMSPGTGYYASTYMLFYTAYGIMFNPVDISYGGFYEHERCMGLPIRPVANQ